MTFFTPLFFCFWVWKSTMSSPRRFCCFIKNHNQMHQSHVLLSCFICFGLHFHSNQERKEKIIKTNIFGLYFSCIFFSGRHCFFLFFSFSPFLFFSFSLFSFFFSFGEKTSTRAFHGAIQKRSTSF